MSANDAIEQFVREGLGCGCPDEVFQAIEYQQHSAAFDRIDIGGRLLVYVVWLNDQSISAQEIDDHLEKGVNERDKLGFNRFRLVLASMNAETVEPLAIRAFEQNVLHDERTHLHVVDQRNHLLATMRVRLVVN